MSWSTRQIAELAGTTVRTVRYYHEIGLLEMPERAFNGYKQYDVGHLARLVRIRRLLELGMTLHQVRQLADLDEHPTDALHRLETEVLEAIQRLGEVHAELRVVIEGRSALDLPPVLGALIESHALTARDQQLLLVLSRVCTPDQIDTLAAAIADLPITEADLDFDALPEDAPAEVCAGLAERLLPGTLAVRDRFPTLPEMGADGAPTRAQRTVQAALAQIYNPAQAEVLRRVARLRAEGRAEERSTPIAVTPAP